MLRPSTQRVAGRGVKHRLSTAYAAFGSASCTELGCIAILCLLGMIASLLVIVPGDLRFNPIYALNQWIVAGC